MRAKLECLVVGFLLGMSFTLSVINIAKNYSASKIAHQQK